MIDIIREVAYASSDDPSLKDLDMRIGVHTGRVVAGIIGSKVVRYDIFGEGVLIANKVESNGIPGKVCVSADTKAYLFQQPDVYAEYQFDEHTTLHLPSINKEIKCYAISRRERESIESAMLSSEARRGLDKYTDSQDGEEQVEDAGSSGEGAEVDMPGLTDRGFATGRPLLHQDAGQIEMADRVAE